MRRICPTMWIVENEPLSEVLDTLCAYATLGSFAISFACGSRHMMLSLIYCQTGPFYALLITEDKHATYVSQRCDNLSHSIFCIIR